MKYTLLIDCSDAKGIVHKATGVLYHNELNVVRNHEFVEPETGRFFMRTEIEGNVDPERIIGGLKGVLPADAQIFLTEQKKKKIVVLVTKEHHCLGELLIRSQFNELNVEILAIIANHPTLETFARQFAVPFYCISHEGVAREEHERLVVQQIQHFNPEYIILAKYMRILSPSFVQHFPNQIINIHHSFLPAFIGANPYRQAYRRGVKIIGATAHFVNDQLDEGPIIVQQVIPVDHTQSAAEMAQSGREVEKNTLAQALKLIVDDRVFVANNKTIIFD